MAHRLTFSDWLKDDYEQEQFNEWKEDGNVIKMDNGYATQDAQYTNRLKNLYELKKYYFNEFIKGQYDNYADGGSLDDKHLVAKAIEYVTGNAVDEDSIQFEANEIAFKYKKSQTWTKISQKLIKDTISMHRKSLELRGRYAKGGGVGKSKINKKYKYFAQNKENGKIYNGWEIVDDVESLKHYAKLDLKDNDLKPSDFHILSAQALIRKGIDPYDSDNWYKIQEKSEIKEEKNVFNDAGTSMAMYHEKKGNFIVPKGQIYLWLYDNEDGASKINSGEYDYVFYPYASMSMAWQKGFIPPLKRIWTKKFQKEHKGSEHLLGVIKAYLIEEKDKKELFIDMMSVNPNSKKKGIMSYMIKDLRDTFNLSKDQVKFSELTKEGEKFVNKGKYADGGSADEEIYFAVVSNKSDKNYNKVGYFSGETIKDKEGNEFEKLYFENEKSPKKYSVNDISYLTDRGEFSKKNKITGTTNYVILVDYQEKQPYFYIYNLTDKFVAVEGYDWSSIVKSSGIENTIYANQKFADGGLTLDEIDDKKKILMNEVDKLIVIHKKKYGNMPIDSPKSKEEKDSDERIANIFSEIQQLIRLKRELLKQQNKYADGGDVPHEDKMFHLPLEMVVYVPSTQDVDKVISVDEMESRVDEVKEYLASKFGGYTSSDKLGGFVDSKGKLVNEEVVQVVAFSTKEAYEENKEALVQKLSDWARRWGQEAIGFEFEGDLMYVPQKFKDGGGI